MRILITINQINMGWCLTVGLPLLKDRLQDGMSTFFLNLESSSLQYINFYNPFYEEWAGRGQGKGVGLGGGWRMAKVRTIIQFL